MPGEEPWRREPFDQNVEWKTFPRLPPTPPDAQFTMQPIARLRTHTPPQLLQWSVQTRPG